MKNSFVLVNRCFGYDMFISGTDGSVSDRAQDALTFTHGDDNPAVKIAAYAAATGLDGWAARDVPAVNGTPTPGTDYNSFKARIERAQSADDIKALTKSLDRLYNTGIFTTNQFARLDTQIIRRHNQIEGIKA